MFPDSSSYPQLVRSVHRGFVIRVLSDAEPGGVLWVKGGSIPPYSNNPPRYVARVLTNKLGYILAVQTEEPTTSGQKL